MKHTWRYAETDRIALLPCRRCGQDSMASRSTYRCVCWKLRLPRRKEEREL